MCGICGVAFADREHPVDEGALQQMRDTMVHRGPDEAGLYLGDGIGLGHRRLRILDLSSAGRQPVATADGRFVICFNGEIYNYRELRVELRNRGATFRTETDTEVLLQMYAHFGSAILPRLNGMLRGRRPSAPARCPELLRQTGAGACHPPPGWMGKRGELHATAGEKNGSITTVPSALLCADGVKNGEVNKEQYNGKTTSA